MQKKNPIQSLPEFWEDCHQSGSATIDDNM